MAPNPQCTAVAAAKQRKGLSYGQIAEQSRMSEQRVIDICVGSAHPTTEEFNSLAKALDMAPSTAPHDSAHLTV